jgi:hypothetical protein
MSLARAEHPVLAAFGVNDDGALSFPADFETAPDTKATAEAGEALVSQLLQLLETFIGETLTLRLVHEVWPAATAPVSKSPRKIA